jgi:hypothetical protein
VLVVKGLYEILTDSYNHVQVIPHMITELHRILSWLDPSKTYVSVYESGSKDSTPSQLSVLHSLLIAMDVSIPRKGL